MDAKNSENSEKVLGREVEQLQVVLGTNNNVKLEQTFASIVQMGEVMIDPLIILLKTSPNLDVQRNAAIALGKFKSQRTSEILSEAFRDSKAYVRYGIIIALSEFKSKKAVSVLLKAIKDNDETLSSLAANSLTKIDDDQIVDTLLNLLLDKKDYVRFNAISVLSSLKNKKSVEPLIGVLDSDKSNWVRSQGAAVALGNIGDKSALKPLIKALGDKDPMVRFYSALALGWLEDLAAIPYLQKIYESDNGEFQGGYERVKDAADNAIMKIIQANKVLPESR